MKRLLFYLVLLLVCTSCVTNQVNPFCSSNESLATQTSPRPLQPLIKVLSVRNSASNEAISEVRLSNFQLAGESIDPNEVFKFDKEIYRDSLEEVNGIVFESDALLCKGTCSFGFSAKEGTYSFDISADGYSTKMVYVAANYKSYENECSSYTYQENAVKLDIVLEPK